MTRNFNKIYHKSRKKIKLKNVDNYLVSITINHKLNNILIYLFKNNSNKM